MKKTTVMLAVLLVSLFCLSACQEPAGYTPTGEFYIKTSPSRGDTGIDYVISLEAESKTYTGSGDVTVPMEVGFGHLPGSGGYDEENTFYVQYRIVESPWTAEKAPVWEKRVEYEESWYDAKYDSTEQKNRPVLIAPNYGQFYPLYKEQVEFVFPEYVKKGYAEVKIFAVIEGWEDQHLAQLRFYFERTDGQLHLRSEAL